MNKAITFFYSFLCFPHDPAPVVFIISRPIQGMSDEWVLWLNGAEISPIQPRPAEWGCMGMNNTSILSNH